jgi:hypothetical protein
VLLWSESGRLSCRSIPWLKDGKRGKAANHRNAVIPTNREDAADVDDEEAQKVARSWTHYSNEENSGGKKHRELQGKIAVKIKEYRK